MPATSTRRPSAGISAAPALRRLLGAAALCGLLPAAAQAQATVITGLNPARNALAAPRTTAIAVTFDKALDTGPDTRSSLRVFSAQTKRSPGQADVSGNTLTLPAETFKAGETVMVTVKSSAQDEIRQIFTQPQVYQFTTATAPSAGRFGAGSEITLPGVPASVAAGDVDGDGKVDVVTVSAAGQVSVSLNQGNGTFRPGPTLTLQPNTKKLLLDDVDGDGDLDILVLSSTVSVRLNDGRGNFYDYGTQEVPTPRDPTDIALGDVDGDGDLDLVISSFYNRRNTASIRLNNGQGVFDKDGSFVSTSANTRKATFGDVDNDGDLDLLLTDAQGQVDVQINNGRGIYNEFINNVSYSLTGNIDTYVSSEVFLRDIDADGDLDILATGATNAKVYILLNDGHGAFPTRREIPVAGIRPLAVGDVNGDGYLDLVTLGAIGATGTTANVRLNDGKGNFSAGQELVISPATPVALALADVNGDGTLDLLAARADQTLSVRLNLPSSVPTPPVAPIVTALSPARNARAAPRTAPVTVTFDQTLSPASAPGLRVFSALTGQKRGPAVVSGKQLTLPAPSFQAGEVVSATVTQAVQSGGGQALERPQVFQFTTATAPSTGRFGGGADATLPGAIISTATGDVDGDGKVDYVTVEEQGQVNVGLNRGDGTFAFGAGTKIAVVGSLYKIKLVLGDIDGDGDLDLLTLGGDLSTGNVDVLFNNGQGQFSGTQKVEGVGREPTDLVLGDVDGDGDLDFVVSSRSRYYSQNTASIWLNNGQGVFDKPGLLLSTSLNTVQATLGDVDNDGDLDLLLINDEGKVDVRTNNGQGIYNQATNVSYSLTGNLNTFTRPEVFLRDVDADGDLDILATGDISDKVYILLNDGRGAFATRREISAPGIRHLAVGDVNGDGYLDLVTIGIYDAPVRLNDGKGNFNAGQELPLRSASFASLDLVDVNGDGTLDLLAAQYNRTLNVRLNSDNLPLQAPVVTSLSPARNARAAPRTAPVTVTFDQVLSPASSAGLRVFGALTGQQRGPAVVSGNTLSLPAPAFQPGEVVSATVTRAVQNGGGQVLERPQVFQFTTATAPSAGRFGGGADVTLPKQPVSTAVGDVNGDGKPDYVTASATGQVNVGLNRGDGTFTFESGSAVTVPPVRKIVLGDVDGDGDLDLLTLGSGVSVRLNNGQGQFSGTQEVETDEAPTDLVLGDVDNDGDLDLLVSRFTLSRNNVNEFLNDGKGIFERGNYIVAFSGTLKVTLGDVNNDGNLDLVLLYYNGSVEVKLNDGQGFRTYLLSTSFSLDKNQLATTVRSDIFLRDMDGDGDLDIVASAGTLNEINEDQIYIRLNDGRGAFPVQREVSMPNVKALAVADVNGDGALDLVTIGLSGTTAHVRLNDGKGNFSPGQELAISPATPVALALADVNGDGTLDLLAARADQTLSVRLNLNNLPPTPPTGATLARLNAGGPALTTSFGAFAADQYYSPSSRTATTRAPIAGTTDQALYRTERYSTNGTLSYAVPVANGRYSVVLHFAEIYWTQPNQRVFNINLEGRKVATNYDIVREVGPRTATTKTFLVTVTDGVLNLDLSVPYATGGRDQAKLSALEILPATAAYQLNAGGPALPTTLGPFAADQYYSPNSRTGATTAPIAGTPDPALYQTERYSTTGTLSYAVPVPAGRYSVVLHFAENYWKQPGQRVFDINLEGRNVVTNYDILAKVAPFTATTETFAVTVTDGVLNLDLTVPYLSGGRDQAKLSALEVLRVDGNAPLGATAVSAAATSQEEATLAAALSVYPNPAAGHFTLSLTSPAAQTATLTLTDQLGRVVQTQALTLQAGANQVPVQAAGLAAGLYQLTLRTADGQRLRSKVSLRP